MNSPTVSVVLCVRNCERYIKKCLTSILAQSYTDFEIIIVDDMSNDDTGNIIGRFSDKRIKYFRNKEWLGISKSRNICVENALGKYLFFTDGDCTVSENWIKNGLKCFNANGCVGVEGAIYYVSEDYEPTFSDHVMENRRGGDYMTGNVAYEKKIVKNIGGFDERLSYLEDRDIALRIMKFGKILFNPEMIVYHPQVILTPQLYIKSSAFSKNRIYLFKKFGDKHFFLGRILFPLNLLKIFFPPLVFISLFFHKFNKREDYQLLPFVYVYAIHERLHLWKASISERVFIL